MDSTAASWLRTGSVEKPEKKKTNPWLIGCLGIIGFVVLAGAIVFAIDIGSQGAPSAIPSTVAPPPTPAPDPAPAPAPAPAPQPPSTANEQAYSIGQDITVNNQAKWRVLSARNRGSVLKGAESRYPSFTNDKVTTGKFIEVTFIVENVSGKTETFAPTPVLIDSQNREFGKADGYWEYVPTEKDFVGVTLQPNIPKEAIVIYEVPQDATGLKLKVIDFSFFSPKTALINLGL